MQLVLPYVNPSGGCEVLKSCSTGETTREPRESTATVTPSYKKKNIAELKIQDAIYIELFKLVEKNGANGAKDEFVVQPRQPSDASARLSSSGGVAVEQVS